MRVLALLCLLLAAATAVRVGVSTPRVAAAATRRNLLPISIAATALALPRAARADGKYDKKFESCLSQCVYEQTKIAKGIAQVEVVSRSEAMASCKQKCATSKDQLLIGQPKK